MPTLDSTAAAAVAGNFAPAWFVWLDVLTDPIRVTSCGKAITFASTGDSDLDGNTFAAFNGEFLDIGDVTNSDSGSDTLTITLSGIVTLDTALLAAIANAADWQGRTCRVWFQIYDATGATTQGGVVAHYTGYMSSVSIKPGRDSQTIVLTVENYLAGPFTAPSNRNYLGQKEYDSADASAAATIASSNGSVRGTTGVSSDSGGGAGGGPGGGGFGGSTGNLEHLA